MMKVDVFCLKSRLNFSFTIFSEGDARIFGLVLFYEHATCTLRWGVLVVMIHFLETARDLLDEWHRQQAQGSMFALFSW